MDKLIPESSKDNPLGRVLQSDIVSRLLDMSQTEDRKLGVKSEMTVQLEQDLEVLYAA